MENSKLQQISELKTKPHYFTSHSEWSESDHKDSELYHKLENELKESSKLLKKGDRVLFNFPKKIKDKTQTFGFRLEDQIMEGTIHKPYYTRKRSSFGEDTSIQLLQVSTSTHIYDVSPEEIEKL